MIKKSLIVLILMTAGLCMTAQQNRQGVGFGKKHSQNSVETLKELKKMSGLYLQTQDNDWWEPDTMVLDYGYAKEREIFSYNKQGLAISRLIQSQSGQSWKNSFFYTYAYDENNNCLSELSQMWEDNSWQNMMKSTYTYNGKNLTTELQQIWDGSAWMNMEQGVYTYDENNNLLTEVWKMWEYDYGWENDMQYIYTYDENNNLLTELFQWWSDKWENEYLDTYTYSGNQIVNVLGQMWEDDEWINEYQANATYEGENIAQVIFQYWEDEQWENEERISIFYDENNNFLNELFEVWISNNWVTNYEIAYTYDDNNNRTEILSRYWDNVWTPENKTTYQYDAHNNANVVENWSWSGNKWEPNFDYCTFFYNNMQSEMEIAAQTATITYVNVNQLEPIDEILNNVAILAYPNPASGAVTISAASEIEQLQIFDIVGRPVHTQTSASKEVFFDTGVLAKGVYLVRVLLRDGRVQTGKVVVR